MQSKSLLVLAVLFLMFGLGACSPTAVQEENGDATEDTGSGATDQVEVLISGFKYDPAEITIQAGTTVTWTNLDPAPHAAVGDNAEWDSGALRKNDTFSFTFETPGTYTYHDSYYAAITGTITVTE